jgi:hypothetical protein
MFDVRSPIAGIVEQHTTFSDQAAPRKKYTGKGWKRLENPGMRCSTTG